MAGGVATRRGGVPPVNLPAGLRPFEYVCRFSVVGSAPEDQRRQLSTGSSARAVHRPKFIAPTSPNEALEPSNPTGMLMLGFRLKRELNTKPVPSVSRP